MKTTIEIDETLLKSVMKLTGFKTRRAAVDYALHEAEKAAKVAHLVREAPPARAFRSAVDDSYDILSLREQEKPKP
jgi:Arc/MetJ family transcription regulator